MRYCDQCGSPLEENANFCIICGAKQPLSVIQENEQVSLQEAEGVMPVIQACQPQNYAGPHEETSPPPKKGLGLLLKIGIPVVAVILIAIVVIFLVVRASPLATTGIALLNLESEFTQRIDSTPLRAITLATEKLENGTVAANFDYSDRWSNIEATATITSNSRNREHSLEVEVDDGRNIITAEAFLNRNRLAVGSSLVDDNFYGITFSTFREDIRNFGREVGMDRNTMDMLADMVELLEMAMNADDIDDTILKPYIQLLTDFVMNTDPESERTQLQVGDESINVRRIRYVITAEDIAALLSDIVEMMQTDSELRDLYESLTDSMISSSSFGWRLFGAWAAPSYSEIMRTLRDAVRSFEEEISGDISISFYIGNHNRLMRMETEVDLRYDGSRARMTIVCDFGTSAHAVWVFTITTNIDGNRTSNEIVWDYDIRSARVINTITITTGDSQQENARVLISDWSKETGRFILSYDSRDSAGTLEGTFTYDENGFSLAFDGSPSGFFERQLDIEITGTTENQVRSIDFINIDEWTNSILDAIEDALWNLGFRFLLF